MKMGFRWYGPGNDPDHGRDIFGQPGWPGYGLYDRALGIAHLSGLGEAITKGNPAALAGVK